MIPFNNKIFSFHVNKYHKNTRYVKLDKMSNVNGYLSREKD